jgi:diacylglycerol kinase family enzyme
MDEARGPVILVISPDAGHAAGQHQLEAALRAAGVEVGQVARVSELDEQAPQGQAWREAGFAAAVAAGGDGTVGAVASHVATSGLPLGVLPLGTANDVARSLSIPLTLDEAAAVVGHGIVYQMDVGYARPATTEPQPTGRVEGAGTSKSAGGTPALEQWSGAAAERGAYFLHTLTLGLNVEFARLATDAARRRRWGPLTYAASAVEAVTQFKPVALSMRFEGVAPTGHSAGKPTAANEATRALACPVIQVAAVITPVFGGSANLRLPGVALRDGLIDVIVVEALEPGRLRALLERLTGAWTPATAPSTSNAPRMEQVLMDEELPGLHWFKTQRAFIEQPEGMDVTLDGEVRARTPIEVGVAPDALSVLLPRKLPEEVLGG